MFGTRIAESISSILSNPVDNISNVSDATQNHTLVVKTRNRTMPSIVIVRVVIPIFADNKDEPEVINSIGMEITAENNGMSDVREKKLRSGILDEIANIIGIAQSIAIIDRSKIKREATISESIAISLAKGLIDCNKPLLLLKSST
jgi:hypothetical protein